VGSLDHHGEESHTPQGNLVSWGLYVTYFPSSRKNGNEDRSTTHGRELCSHNADLKGELERFRPIRDRSSETEQNRREETGN
jgi:hypothetical protein